MKFTNIKNLKYSSADNSLIDILATCVEYGEIPMTLNIVDTEDLHYFATGTFETVIENDIEIEKEILIPLEEYCKTLKIAPYIVDLEPLEKNRVIDIKAKAGEIITSRYNIIKQMNIYGEGGEAQLEMITWIKKIRDISNKAEADGTALADIIWE